MMSAKMATPGLLKIKVFWNKDYYVIYSIYDVPNKILSHDSNFIMDVVMWPKFGSCSICIREVIITSIYKDLAKKTFFEGWSWFKCNNLWLPLGTNFKFFTSLWKGLKLKVTKFWGLFPTFVGVTWEKLLGGPFYPPPPPHILNRVKIIGTKLCVPIVTLST